MMVVLMQMIIVIINNDDGNNDNNTLLIDFSAFFSLSYICLKTVSGFDVLAFSVNDDDDDMSEYVDATVSLVIMVSSSYASSIDLLLVVLD